MQSVKIARVDCSNEHEEDSEKSWIASAALIGEITCPICDEPLEPVESYESSLAEIQTDPESELGLI